MKNFSKNFCEKHEQHKYGNTPELAIRQGLKSKETPKLFPSAHDYSDVVASLFQLRKTAFAPELGENEH